MKPLSLRLGVILIGLVIFGSAEAWGADWKYYGSNELDSNYYDAQSITRPSKNVVRVWERRDFTEKGVIVVVKILGGKYENVSYSITLREINCLEKKNHSLLITYYDNKGGVIFSSSSPLDWEFIVPKTMGESLYKQVCK